ncbi:MAG: DUF308 domain-containing protein [Clostridiales bacterium]|nr:DUF308 domain-containing protein [Candidatus Coliplasma caballi]
MPNLPRLTKLQKRFRRTRKTDFAAADAIVRSAKSIHLFASALMLGAGLLLCLKTGLDSKIVRLVFAGCCLLMGSADLFGYYSNDLFRLAFQFAFTFGSFSLLFGVLLLLAPSHVLALLPCFVGLYVILDGLQKVQLSLECRKFGIGKWPLILGTSVLVTALGVVSVLLFDGSENRFLWMGIAVSADGAENFWTTMYTVRGRSASRTHDAAEK